MGDRGHVGAILAARELARLGRSKHTYAYRLLALGAVLAGTVILWALDAGNIRGATKSAALAGTFFDTTLTLFQLAVVFGLTPVLSAGLVGEERHENNLDLLTLAGFRGWDVFLPKFAAAFLQAGLLLLSSLPMAAFAAFFGGISVPIAARRLAVMCLAAATVCAVSMLVGAKARHPGHAVVSAFGIVGLWLAATEVADFVCARYGIPAVFNVVRLALTEPAPGARLHWIPCVVLHGAILAVAAVLTTASLSWRLERRGPSPSCVRGIRTPWGKGFVRLDRIGQLVAANASGFSIAFGSKGMRCFTALVLMVAAAVPIAGWVCVAVLLEFEVCSSMAAARRGRLVSDLLTVPLEAGRLPRTLFRVFSDRELVYLPAFVAVEALWLVAAIAAAAPTGFNGLVTLNSAALVLPVMCLGLGAMGLSQLLCAVVLGCCAGSGEGATIRQTAVASATLAVTSVAAHTPGLLLCIFLEQAALKERAIPPIVFFLTLCLCCIVAYAALTARCLGLLRKALDGQSMRFGFIASPGLH